MKKQKLIELLQTIEGNPDIMLWNGIVGDVVDLKPKLVEVRLVKQTQAFYHQQKIVYILDAKLTGKTSYSRCGNIDY